MLTLVLVTVPIEIIFLAMLRTFGWLKLPILFAIFSLAFFCCAVSVPNPGFRTRTQRARDRHGYPSSSHTRSRGFYGRKGWILTCTRYPFTPR